jgi:transposase InsO family protein
MGLLQPFVGYGSIIHLQPFNIVGLDFITPITPASSTGNRYIILMVDYFTRYLYAKAVGQETGAAARGLFESVTETFGNPLAVYTDNEAHFTGEDFHEMLMEREIKQFPAQEMHCSSLGLAECYIQLLIVIQK